MRSNNLLTIVFTAVYVVQAQKSLIATHVCGDETLLGGKFHQTSSYLSLRGDQQLNYFNFGKDNSILTNNYFFENGC